MLFWQQQNIIDDIGIKKYHCRHKDFSCLILSCSAEKEKTYINVICNDGLAIYFIIILISTNLVYEINP